MPRKREKISTKGLADISQYVNAYNAIKNGTSVRSAARQFNVNNGSLIRYKRKREKTMDESGLLVSMGYSKHAQVFTEAQEKIFSEYLIECADHFHKLSSKDVRRLAFKLATRYEIKFPVSWLKREMAGEDWSLAFMKRNPNVSDRITRGLSFTDSDMYEIDSTFAWKFPRSEDDANYLILPQQLSAILAAFPASPLPNENNIVISEVTTESAMVLSSNKNDANTLESSTQPTTNTPKKRKKGQRISTKGQHDIVQYMCAYNEVKNGSSVRKAAKLFNLNHKSLYRYQRKRESLMDATGVLTTMGYSHNKVFSQAQEKIFSDYLISCANVYSKLTGKEIRKLAYELAMKYNLRTPKSWTEKEIAGEDWLRSFMSRNPDVSRRLKAKRKHDDNMDIDSNSDAFSSMQLSGLPSFCESETIIPDMLPDLQKVSVKVEETVYDPSDMLPQPSASAGNSSRDTVKPITLKFHEGKLKIKEEIDDF